MVDRVEYQMKCIFLFTNAPLSSNFSGAASRYLNSFLAFHKLGIDIHVWRFLSKSTHSRVLAHEKKESKSTIRLRSYAATWDDIVYTPAPIYNSRAELLYKALFCSLETIFSESNSLRNSFICKVNEVNPDFIWAEGGAAAALVAGAKLGLPWVYANHDLYFRLSKLRQQAWTRNPYWSERIHLWSMQRGEMQIIRNANAIATGSQTEANELIMMGGRKVTLIPTTYESESVNLGLSKMAAHGPARIIHLGSLRTTSNYLGLMAYLEKVYPRLAERKKNYVDELFQLHIIGDIEGAKPAFIERLRASGAHFYGHMDDLGAILRPFDVVIIPYEHDTGTRTKLPLLFNYAQVVVATEASVAGSPEVRSGENCIVLPTLDAFADELVVLVYDYAKREQLGRNAKETFDLQFTLDAQLPKFAQLIKQICINYEA